MWNKYISVFDYKLPLHFTILKTENAQLKICIRNAWKRVLINQLSCAVL